MKFKIHLIPEDGLHMEGEEAPAIMDLNEPLYRFEKPVHYSLDATLLNGRSLMVLGRLTTTVRACCVRTLEWFDLPVEVAEFQYHRDSISEDEVDLTGEIREDILLALPSNPVAPQSQPLDNKADQLGAQKEVWKKLDQLHID
jgi:uncharacterized metal-binding protein YceD (DUF177 family)